ncbi:MAG TPA: SDR family NAD(P)-dependent oxidoreductase, partial [Blastocatellia bacterium]|nr:SDR family NAD(P)-dependent oxidoreductase [Blastocatellia bacterium]
MNEEFKGQIAMITGGASGLGLSIAKRLAAGGATVVLCDLHEDALQSAANQIGNQAVAFQLDVANETQVGDVVNSIAERFGKIDILVNSAGVTGQTNIKSHEANTENVRFVFEVNFMGSFFTSRAVLPLMLKQSYGRILHISSI